MPYTIAIDARKIRDFGIGTYIRNLIDGLAALDAENHYALFAHPQDLDLLAHLPPNFETIPESSAVYSVRELGALSVQLLRLKPDLYHATHYVLPLATPPNVVVTIHDIIHLLYPEFLPNGLAFLYARRMIRRSLDKGRRIIAVSGNTRADLMDYFDVDGKKIEVVYNGVEESYRQRLSPQAIDARLAPHGLERPYLLFVGNPKPHKNLDNVVRAYARARTLGVVEAPLVVVGDRSGLDLRVRLLTEQLGIQSHVRLLGHVEQSDLPALYQGAAIFLYPTLYEGFGLPVVEAMASGTAVITSRTSALREIAEGAALLVDPLDVDAMAHAIAGLLADPTQRIRFSELGRRRAERFRWADAARRTLAIYHAAIEGSAPEETQ